MTAPGGDLVERVLAALPPAERYVVAFSGGADSTALVSLLAGQVSLRAVHVEHGLQPEARGWPAHCAEVCRQLNVPYRCLRVALSPPDRNREAWAREQRYRLLAEDLQAGEVLLTAHHLDDQAETVLLHLLRGSGLEGLAAMRRVRPLGSGRLARPLLEVCREDLRRYCRERGMPWVSDPSNRDLDADRNYLRHEIMPRLRQRWAAAPGNLARSAGHLAEAGAVQQQFGDELLAMAENSVGGLDLVRLAEYSPGLRNLVFRRWLARHGLPLPRTHQWGEIWRQLESPADRQVCLTWPGAVLRRYRSAVYAVGDRPKPPAERHWRLTEPLDWPGYGVLLAQAWPPAWEAPELRACAPVGGERMRLRPDGPRRRLKVLWQEAGVPPWERARAPVLFRGDELVAVGDMWIAASAAGLRIKRISPEHNSS